MNRIYIYAIMVVAVMASIVLAVDIANADYLQLSIYAAVAAVLYFVINGWKNVWWFTALLIFTGVSFNHGFVFSSLHLFVLMLAAASGIAILRQGPMPQVSEFKKAGSKSTAIIVGTLVLYGVLHFFVYYALPYEPTDYAVKNSLKAYFSAFASMVCFLWLLIGPYGFRLKSNWFRVLIRVIVVGLLANVAARAYMFHMGFDAPDNLIDDGMEFYMLVVPLINMYPGIYTLRAISPLACVILLMIATAPGMWGGSRLWTKLLLLAGIALCFVGALLSGGRATMLFCLALSLFVSLHRKQFALIGLMATGAVILIAIINIFSTQINRKAPASVARTMQMVMIDKGSAAANISHSQDSRNAAFEKALKEWSEGDMRHVFFGRSVFPVTAWDIEYASRGAEEFAQVAMRSGNTHNLITDLLSQYGIVGLMLYIAAQVAVIHFVWKLHREISDQDVIAKALAGAMRLYMPLIFIYQALGGGFMTISVALAIGLIRAHLLHYRVARPSRQATSVKTEASYSISRRQEIRPTGSV